MTPSSKAETESVTATATLRSMRRSMAENHRQKVFQPLLTSVRGYHADVNALGHPGGAIPMIPVILFVAFALALLLLPLVIGADSRDGRDWQSHADWIG